MQIFYKKEREDHKRWFSIILTMKISLLLVFFFVLQASATAKSNDKNNISYLKLAPNGIKISGVIKDAKSGEPLPGATVQVKGTSTGTITDLEGKFALEVPNETAELNITFIGYTSQTIVVGTNITFNILLSEVQNNLEEVVVVGYGVQKKKLNTGATVQLKSDELVKDHVTRVESALQGKTAGVSITKISSQPGSNFNIVIRGAGSTGGSNPLVIVDGVPGSLNNLNPDDIASVDILKDAASAAIYGTRASDGVILVTTKKGKSGEMVVSYDGYLGVSNPYNRVSVLNAKEYAIIMNEQQVNSGQSPFFTPAQINAFGSGTDWQKETFNLNAKSQSHHIGITGGNDKSTFAASLSYSKEAGIFGIEDKSQMERFGFMLNSEHKVKSWLKFGQNLSYNHSNSSGIGDGNVYDNAIRNAIAAPPIMNIYDPKQADGYAKDPNMSPDQANPVALLHYKYNNQNRWDNIAADVFAEIEFTKNLKFRSDFGGKYDMGTNQTFNPSYQLTPVVYNSTDNATEKAERYYNYNFDNTLTFQKDFGKHNVLAMVGMNSQDSWFFIQSAKASSGSFSDFDHAVLSNYTTVTASDITGSIGKGDALISYFGRASYNYDEKYMATATIRRDGSSKFGPNNRFGYFPSVSLGWVITKEAFMTPYSNSLEFLKLRASWGQNGKEPVKSFQYMATMSKDQRSYYFGDESTKGVGFSPDILPNPNLKWESTEQLDLGLDARFLKHFALAIDLYNKTSKDWIVEVPVATITGQTSTFLNGGNVSNKGIEFDLGYSNNIGDLTYDIKANISFNKNKVTGVPTPDGIIHGATSVPFNGAAEIARVQEGFPIGYFWGLKTAGVFQTDAEAKAYKSSNGAVIQPNAQAGDVKFVDLNDDGKIDDNDKTQIGDPNPHYTYGINLGAGYKGFDLAVTLQGRGGNQVFEGLRSTERFYNNYSTEILDRWTGPGTSNHIPRVTRGDEANQNWNSVSDLYIHDADFLRIKSVSLGYDFKKFIPKAVPISQFRVYVSASNLYTFTGYKGTDPEVGYTPNAFGSGVDIGTYPIARTYLFGVNVKF